MTDWYEFTCPACSSSFGVDDSIRAELLARGCPWCEAALTPAAFAPADGPGDSC